MRNGLFALFYSTALRHGKIMNILITVNDIKISVVQYGGF